MRRALRAVGRGAERAFGNSLFMAAWCAGWATYDAFVFTGALRWVALTAMALLTGSFVNLHFVRRRNERRFAEAEERAKAAMSESLQKIRKRFLNSLIVNGMPEELARRTDWLIDNDRPSEAAALLTEYFNPPKGMR